ncbi:hypothetical protein V494_07233 [Pseudogymnoascus sp. VKM F-4513 (FW-928)]|nr:hypothetical protein V494_07233 [Pseudogymnoascus sp. VKM F-4513 (FW-928)]
MSRTTDYRTPRRKPFSLQASMRFTVIALFFIGALASPLGSVHGPRQEKYEPCNGKYLGTEPACCDTDIVGAPTLKCRPPSKNPGSPAEFKALCGPKAPSCCPTGSTGEVFCPQAAGFGEEPDPTGGDEGY